MMATRPFIAAVFVVLLVPHPSLAQGKVKVAREAAEYVLRKFGKEAAEGGVETLSRKIEVLVAQHGEEAIVAVRKVGPRTFRIVDEAGVGCHPRLIA